MSKKYQTMKKAIRMEIKEHRKSFLVYLTLRALVILVMILQIFNRNFENVFLCLLTLILLIVPSFLQVELKIELPTALEIIILLFIFSAEILGEIQSFYILIPMWDTILHTLNGFLAAAIGFSLVDLLNNDDRLQFRLSPVFMALVAFCFSMTIGVIWEFFEFGMDTFLGTDMQKDTIVQSITTVMLDPTNSNIPITIDGIHSVVVNGKELGFNGYLDIGLIDTMEDLLVNFIGASTFSILGYFYVKKRGKGAFTRQFLPRRKTRDAVAFCFSMTIGVIWEFFEFGMDTFLGTDMQKDTIVQSITTVMLDPTNSNIPITIDGIHSVVVNGKELGFNGYLDIGLIDTMEDLLVNFIGASTFSILGYFYVKKRGKGAFTRQFLPRRKTRDADFKRLARKELEQEEHEKQKEAGKEAS